MCDGVEKQSKKLSQKFLSWWKLIPFLSHYMLIAK